MKVVFIQAELAHYRLPLFTAIAKFHELTLISSAKGLKTHKSHIPSYRQIILPAFKIGPFFFKRNIFQAIRSLDFDVIILPDHIVWPQYILIRLFFFNKRFIWFGVDDLTTIPFLLPVKRFFFNLLPDKCLCYTPDIAQRLASIGFVDSKIIPFNNTLFGLDYMPTTISSPKYYFVSVGSLNYRKRLDLLVSAYAMFLCNTGRHDVKLRIVGEGPDYNRLVDVCNINGLDYRSIFVGPCIDPKELFEIYSSAIISVSPMQAGLAILQSFAYGVPFVTFKNAISGGEAWNLIHEYNGCLVHSLDSLVQCMIKVSHEPEYRNSLALNAYNHFNSRCSSDQMVTSLLEAIAS